MFRRNIYYTLKPLLPLRFRRAVRGWYVRRRLRDPAVRAVWPILESAGEKPEGWSGWPEGKQFALVLTHDVEGPEGLAKVRPLAELEMSLGLRSSFNFIPEGGYTVPADLRAWLTENGFEVGVHDLHHDGHLYRSREHFRNSAERINRYLEEWGAVGYRSGFMLHNLEWHHDLDVLYDASSFDTDPFEPQPDGVGTIFPFFVEKPENGQTSEIRNQKSDPPSVLCPPSSGQSSDLRPSDLGPSTLNIARKGYVELPYTLPQDSTLFFLLQERTTEIWERKLDWIAEKGGMALLNTHPDYMTFGPHRGDREHFSAADYAAFLKYVSKRYDTRFWKSLPMHVASFSRTYAPSKSIQTPRRICMVTYSVYEFDNRVRRYAETLAARGDEVEVLAVAACADVPREEVIDGVHVRRLVRKKQLKSSLAAYFAQVASFFLSAFATLSYRSLRKRYDLVHVHNMPDFVAFTALLPRLRGARVILDIHDLVPELFVDKADNWHGRLASRMLRWEERISAAFCHHVIISNHLWLDTVTARSVPREKCSVFINNVDSRVFYRRTSSRSDDRRIILFHGSLSRHQGVDLVVRAMPAVMKRVPTVEFHVYGAGSEMDALQTLARELGVGDAVCFHNPVALHKMPQIIAEADVGVVAKRADGFGNRAYSTKIMEFLSQQVPVVLSRTEIDQFYFDDSVARFFDSGDVEGLADALIDVLTDEELRARLAANACAYVAQNDWATRQRDYLGLVDSLIEHQMLPKGLADPPKRVAPTAEPTPVSAA